jgi:5-formyltetrahydrofolate cyclo-ligase
MSNVVSAKDALRAKMRALRRALPKTFRAEAEAKILSHFAELLKTLPKGALVSGYLAQGAELDAAPLLHKAAAMGFPTALPVVKGEGAALAFYPWRPDEALTRGAFGIRVPARQDEEVLPDLCLVPLLAFDAAGHRLGQGGGYFDRTLARLKADKAALAVGLGFSAQAVPAIPFAAHDHPLDAILTEKGLQRFG